MSVQTMRAVVKGTLGGVVEFRNIFTANVDLVSPDTYQQIWTFYLNGIYEHVMPLCHAACTLYSVELFTQFGTQWVSSEEFSYVSPGTASGEALPNLIAAPLIAKAAGVRSVGRKFFGGLAEVSTNGNALVASALVSMASALAAWIGLFTTAAGSTLSPGIVNKDHLFRPFLSGIVSQLLGTCRRRKPGRGI